MNRAALETLLRIFSMPPFALKAINIFHYMWWFEKAEAPDQTPIRAVWGEFLISRSCFVNTLEMCGLLWSEDTSREHGAMTKFSPPLFLSIYAGV
jgi:hypothetical protein